MPELFDITPFTLLDYPDELACIAWFAGCNLRCVYCHNPEIVHSKGRLGMDAYAAHLRRRQGQLTGVVLSGGEPTWCRALPDYARLAKELGYKVKLDTNGARPAMLEKLLNEGLIDYVALDYKCLPQQSADLLGTEKFVPHFDQSLDLLIRHQDRIKLEIRTTFLKDAMTADTLTAMAETLDQRGYRGTYYIQNIVSTGEKTLGNIPETAISAAPTLHVEPRHLKLAFRNFAA